MLCYVKLSCHSGFVTYSDLEYCNNALSLQLALLDKYEEILLKATAAAEDRKLTGSSKYKVRVVVENSFNQLSLVQQNTKYVL